MAYQLYQVDAFTGSLFSGNPAAVCPLNSWLPTELMQQIAAENNLSETAFFVPNGEDFEIRWFTPKTEVALCGHATLATAHVLYKHLGYNRDLILFHTRESGTLRVSRFHSWINLDFPTDSIAKIKTPKAITDGLTIENVEVYKGKTDYMVVVESEEVLEKLKPDFKNLSKLDARGVIVTAAGNSVDFVSRCFYPQCGIDEDPVTGSAHTTLAPFWADRLGKRILSAQQISTRGGDLRCEMLGNGRVEISGQARTYMKAEIKIADYLLNPVEVRATEN